MQRARELNFAIGSDCPVFGIKSFISYVGKGFLEEFSAVYNKMPEIALKGNGQGMSIHAVMTSFSPVNIH